jgi:hypothetical protein
MLTTDRAFVCDLQCKELVNTKGMFSFYEDGHQECCRIRKVAFFPSS